MAAIKSISGMTYEPDILFNSELKSKLDIDCRVRPARPGSYLDFEKYNAACTVVSKGFYLSWLGVPGRWGPCEVIFM